MINEKLIVHFTHHDLDALGCCLHLDYATPGIKKKTFHTNYRDIEEKTSEVYDYCIENKPKLLLITDISFASSKLQLKKLEEILSLTKVILLDHHEYPENFFNDIKIKSVIDITKSATKITQEKLKTKGKNKNLDALSDMINIFDIWLSKEKSFGISLALNSYFWRLNDKLSIEQILEKIKNNDYKPPKFKEFYKNNMEKVIPFLKKSREKKLITSDGFFTVAFIDDYFNEVLYEEFNSGVEFVMIANSYGITRFRFNTSGKLTRKQKEEIKLKLIGTLDIGHLNAFSDKIQNSNFDKIMARVEEVYKIVDKYKS